jgi:hypothetical protein
MTRYRKVSNKIRGGDGHIIHESTKEEIKGTNIIRRGDGERILYQNREDKE